MITVLKIIIVFFIAGVLEYTKENKSEFMAVPVSLAELDLLIVENVGNLVCPASFQLGTHRSVLVASVPEGDDKPYKYPVMYRGVDALVLNKIDVLDAFDFDVDYFRRGVEVLNPGLAFFPLSCKTGEGLDSWLVWLCDEMRRADPEDGSPR